MSPASTPSAAWIMRAEERSDATREPKISVGVPYGSRARLIMLYLQSEALKTINRSVELGKSLLNWLGKMGIPPSGKSIQSIREQAERIWLRPGGYAVAQALSEETLNSRRVALLKRTLLESQAQIDWLLTSEPELASVPSFAAADLARSQEEVINLRDRLVVMERQYTAALQRVEALEVSTIWRASLPFRTLVDGFRRTKASLTRAAR